VVYCDNLTKQTISFAGQMQSIETLKYLIFKPLEQRSSSESGISSASVEIIRIL
jgi:hypothetical protein